MRDEYNGVERTPIYTLTSRSSHSVSKLDSITRMFSYIRVYARIFKYIHDISTLPLNQASADTFVREIFSRYIGLSHMLLSVIQSFHSKTVPCFNHTANLRFRLSN